MLQITNEFRQKIVAVLLEARKNFDGSDSQFATKWRINSSVFSRLKSGEVEGLLRDNQWLDIGCTLGVTLNERKWNVARTAVFTDIEEDIAFCQAYSKARIYVDDCGIGKTFTARYLARTLKNCFYLDCSQARTKTSFIRALAQTIGVDNQGRMEDVLTKLKYYLKMLPNPIVILDEAGDLEYEAFLTLKGIWNATEERCGWYMMGADGLREKITSGIKRKKVGFPELFSRYSEGYTHTVPYDRQEKLQFYRQLITDVLLVNMEDKSKLNEIVKRCLTENESGKIGGLRRAESLLILSEIAA